jgi:CubicO group peptidase (beta-lactamase class C family)
MKDTSFKMEKLNRKRFARPYYPLIGSLYIPMPDYDIGCASACGGLRTTAIDLSKYMMAHMNNGTFNNYSMLNKSTVELMHTIQYPETSSKFYIGTVKHGLGWMHLTYKDDVWEGYNGGAIGYCCNMMFRQSDHIGVIMMINSHFKRIYGKIAEIKLDMHYDLADIFIQKALENC